MVAMLAMVAGGAWLLYGNPVAQNDIESKPAVQRRAPGGQEQMAVLLQLNPVGGMARIHVNGKELGENGGAVLIPTEGPLVAMVPQSGTLKVSIEANGFKPLEYESGVDLQKLGVGAYGKELRVSLAMEPEVYGVLKYRSGIANASLRVEIGGQNWVYKSSLTGGTEVVKLPPGTYRLEFFSSSLNMSQVIPGVVIDPGSSIEQDVILRK